MAAESLKFNMFEMYSNEDPNVSVSLMGSGNPVIEYRESVFMPYVEIVAHLIDTGNTLPADDGEGEGIGEIHSSFWYILCKGFSNG